MELEPLPKRRQENEGNVTFRHVASVTNIIAQHIGGVLATPLYGLGRIATVLEHRSNQEERMSNATHEAGHALIGHLLRMRQKDLQIDPTLFLQPHVVHFCRDENEIEQENPTMMLLFMLAGCAADHAGSAEVMRNALEKKREWTDVTIPMSIIRHRLMALRTVLGPDHYPSHQEDLDDIARNILQTLNLDFSLMFERWGSQGTKLPDALHAVKNEFLKRGREKHAIDSIIEEALRKRGIRKEDEVAMRRLLASINLDERIARYCGKKETPNARRIDEEMRSLLSHTHIGKKRESTERNSTK